jgi:hypothetical protein
MAIGIGILQTLRMSVIKFRDSVVMNQCIANTSIPTSFASFIQLILNTWKLVLTFANVSQAIWMELQNTVHAVDEMKTWTPSESASQ